MEKQLVSLGIDLAIKNCGLCFLYDDGSYVMTVCGMKDYTDQSVVKFANVLKSLVADNTLYVDFSFNECSFPGRKKYTALKYFLAGSLLSVASQCNFVSGSQLRKHYYCNSKMAKKDFHKLLIPEMMLEQYTEHELDAYLLAKMYKG